MIRDARRVRLLRQALACTTLAFLMAACGGGGGGATPPDNGGGTPPPESAYLLAEFVAGDANNQFVRVWDPAHPAVAVQNVRLVMSNGIVWTSSHLVFSDATRYDTATRTVTTLGHAKVFYDNDGKLYSIDLRGGQSHVPVRLSSAVDVFMPVGATPMNAVGDDAWVDAQGGAHHWAIRTTMGAGDAPNNILQIVAPLRDAATGFPQYFFASLGDRAGTHVQPTTYEIVDTNFAPVANAAVAGMVEGDGWSGADPAQPGLGYLRIAGALRELHWSAGAVGVDAASLHTFGPLGQALPVADAQSLYLNDGNTLMSLSNGTLHTIGSFSTSPLTLVDAGGYVAGVEANGVTITQVHYQVEAMAKADGTTTLIEAAAPTLQLLAASDQGLILAGTLEQPQAFVLASGDNRTRTTMGSQWVGVVRAASARLDQPAAPVAVLSCEAGTTAFCVPGPLTQWGLSGGSVALGTLAAAAPMVRGDAVVGLLGEVPGQTLLSAPGGFADQQTDRRDAWQFTPAVAGSVQRVTSNLP